MKKLLFIAYNYPPVAGVGTPRAYNFAKNLPAYGWSPTVIAPSKVRQPIDFDFPQDLPPPGKVIRTGSLTTKPPRLDHVQNLINSISRKRQGRKKQAASPPIYRDLSQPMMKKLLHNFIYIPDGQNRWFPSILKSAKKVLLKEKFDAIFSTSFPITSHIAAMVLKTNTGLPWIADFRDPWARNHFQPNTFIWRKTLNAIIEKRIVESADVVTVVSNNWKHLFMRDYVENKDKIATIYNGYDPDVSAKYPAAMKEKGVFRIVITGTLYGRYQDLGPFYEALGTFIQKENIPESRLEVCQLGIPDKFNHEQINRYQLQGIVKELGFQSRRDSYAWQRSADLLLLITWSRDNEVSKGVIPAKFFEYLNTNHPILALAYDGNETAKLIQNANAGSVVSPMDIDGIRMVLRKYYGDFHSPRAIGFHPDNRVIEQFAFPKLTGRLAKLLDSIVVN